MQTIKESLGPTTFKLKLVADIKQLEEIKQRLLTQIGSQNLKLPGFRSGKAPLNLVEKNVDQNRLQSEFLEQAVSRLYVDAISELKMRPVEQPKVSITKFVPFTTLELSAEVEAVGTIKLPDYKKTKLTKPLARVTEKEIVAVLEDLKTRFAEKQEVQRPAALGDELIIDFKGTDPKTKQQVNGADGKDYPLLLGSNNFIPGFEKQLIGLKPGATKEFKLVFPKDYGLKNLQNREVSFTVNVLKIYKLSKPELNKAFATKVGPFKTIDDLRSDIGRQVTQQNQQQIDRDYQSQLLETITAKSEVAIPRSLIDQEVEAMEAEERQNLAYRGQTWDEHLAEEGVTQEEHHQQKQKSAELRVKAGLLLSEIAEIESIKVSSEELELQLQSLKSQYQDKAMLAELDKPDNVRTIASRLLSEKTIQRLSNYATSK
ncbi:MAG TPA: trigger factor [Candidatus Dormibacteraeota bacterium]|nr:trigger factor [Candidatus Dormibacteraeota bacterium]